MCTVPRFGHVEVSLGLEPSSPVVVTIGRGEGQTESYSLSPTEAVALAKSLLETARRARSSAECARAEIEPPRRLLGG